MQFLRALEVDTADDERDLHDELAVNFFLGSGKNDGVWRELGMRMDFTEPAAESPRFWPTTGQRRRR